MHYKIFLLALLNTFALASCKSRWRGDKGEVKVQEARNFVTYIQDLSYITPVICKTKNIDTVTSFILTADNDSRVHNKIQYRPYTNSVQIIDADQPWPPRWFSSTEVYPDENFNMDSAAGIARFDYLQDARIVSGYFSFYKILSRSSKQQVVVDRPEFAAYLLLNDKMECVDTVKSATAMRNIYFHDVSINAKGERLTSVKKDTYLDLRDYSGNQADNCVHCYIDIIEILDSKDSIIFSWNPLYHIDPGLFQFKETLSNPAFGSGNSDIVNWTRLTSVQWDYDGDIIYSLKNLGIGKLSRTDGHVIWQISYNQMPIIAGKDTVQW